MPFARFMAGTAGRVLRIVAGLVLAALGVTLLVGGAPVGGVVLLVLGAVFVVVGAANLCLLAPLFRVPFRGRDVLALR